MCGRSSKLNSILISDGSRQIKISSNHQFFKQLLNTTLFKGAVSKMGQYENDHNGQYPYNSGDASHKDRSAARKTHDAWDKVLYGIGSVYFKLVGK